MMLKRISFLTCFTAAFMLFVMSMMSCNDTTQDRTEFAVNTLFTSLPGAYTGIDFANNLSYTEEFNPYTYRNFYNGGGVGVGDINNDGLLDIYFCGNLVDNKLYLNRGDFQFEDVTKQAGLACKGVWSSGVSIADVNGDGWLDIYVCKSGSPEGDNRYNELFINEGKPDKKGIPSFKEEAKDYGIADKGLSTHAAFFDYDRDGDLDCYLLNNSYRPVGKYDLRKDQRKTRDPLGGNKLYRNDDGKFADVSEQAGIYGSTIGFGLGVTVGDINRDGWQDIFVSNDFFERDYLYLNNQDGSFTECLERYIRSTALGAMGADMADINNDGLPEIFVTDMLPEDDARMKTKTNFENWDKSQINVRQGYYHQFTRNMLQLNRGGSPGQDDPGTYFSEIGRLAGVSATDWSWGALMMDMDNDGHRDIFVANGIYKDLTDQDYINFYSPSKVREVLFEEKGGIESLIDAMPTEALPNYAFHNQGDLTFTNQAEAWGLDQPGFSNGSAYGDFDNDGDLDLVCNNVNMPAFVYRNESDSLRAQNHYIQFQLEGKAKNHFAIGTQLTLYHDGEIRYAELNPMRGFESTVDHRVHIGLGNWESIDSIRVLWPDGQPAALAGLPVNQLHSLKQGDTSQVKQPSQHSTSSQTLFTDITNQVGLTYSHQENPFQGFSRDRLLIQMKSADGPRITTGDVTGDGRPDYYICGAKGQAGQLFIQTPNGSFRPGRATIFEQNKLAEEVDALFFDSDGDRDLDLYVACGGYEFPATSSALLDRLYINKGKGDFELSDQILPANRYENSACVDAADIDKDGDLDLFVGIRLKPMLYGVPVSGYLLQNDGKGNFTNITVTQAPGLKDIGMMTDAEWVDIDGDKDKDLIVVGEWMQVKVFENQAGKLSDITESAGLTKSNGFWNCLKAADIDDDGDMDFVVGNLGFNSRIKATANQPASMYVNDFDGNGRAEQVISAFNGGAAYPLVLRQDLVMQMPGLKKKYLKHEDYKNQQVADIFSPEILERAVQHKVFQTATSLFINDGKGNFEVQALPIEAQFAPAYGLLIEDFDQDGKQDILLSGNFHRVKPEIGRYDASYGVMLKGDGQGQFVAMPLAQSGFFTVGECRDMEMIATDQGAMIAVAKNNEPIQFFRINQ